MSADKVHPADTAHPADTVYPIDWLGLIRAGRPLNQAGVRVIDAHAHLGRYFNFYIPRPDAATMVELMDRLGVDHIHIGPAIIRVDADATRRIDRWGRDRIILAAAGDGSE